MSVRPKDLTLYRAQHAVLHCWECLTDYTAAPAAYAWLPKDEPLVCAGCGAELSLEDKILVDA